MKMTMTMTMTMKKTIPALATLSDDQIIHRGDRAVRGRHELAIELLDCLVEVERRELYLKEGYSSLFAFCTDRWNSSPPNAGRTIAAARCVRDFPAVRSLLVEQKITMCGVSRIAGILTEEYSPELLGRVSGKKYADIDRIVAACRRAPVIRERIRPIGTKTRPGSDGKAGDGELFRHDAAAGAPNKPAAKSDDSQFDRDNQAVKQDPAAPLSREERYEIRFSAGKYLVRMLEQAKAICSRRATLEALLVKVLDEFLEKHDPERRRARREERKAKREGRRRWETAVRAAIGGKTCAGAPPRKPESGAPPQASGRSRHIPAALRDAVFARDGGRCTFVGRSGVRCTATTHLQVDHIEPFCRGGTHTLGNLRLLCGKHNRLTARELALSP